MDVQKYLNKFHKEYDGNYSIIYDFIKDRLLRFEPYELPYPEEFIFFECRYVAILEDIKKRNLKINKIIDIGCQLGVQSELFKDDYNYVGIDSDEIKFFNEENLNCKYIVGTFPNVEIDYNESVVISSMSLGYFDYNNNESVYLENIVEELKKVKYLYIATNRKLLGELKKYFSMEHISCASETDFKNDESMKDVSNNLYFCIRNE